MIAEQRSTWNLKALFWPVQWKQTEAHGFKAKVNLTYSKEYIDYMLDYYAAGYVWN